MSSQQHPPVHHQQLAPVHTVQPQTLSQQEFPDVPGSESMQFMERMMTNIRRMSHGQAV